jgi:hypothetical protein
LFAAFNILLVRFRGNAGFGGGGAGTGIAYLLCSIFNVCLIHATSVLSSAKLPEIDQTAAKRAARPMELMILRMLGVSISAFSSENKQEDASASSSGERFRNQDQHDAYGNA